MHNPAYYIFHNFRFDLRRIIFDVANWKIQLFFKYAILADSRFFRFELRRTILLLTLSNSIFSNINSCDLHTIWGTTIFHIMPKWYEINLPNWSNFPMSVSQWMARKVTIKMFPIVSIPCFGYHVYLVYKIVGQLHKWDTAKYINVMFMLRYTYRNTITCKYTSRIARL